MPAKLGDLIRICHDATPIGRRLRHAWLGSMVFVVDRLDPQGRPIRCRDNCEREQMRHGLVPSWVKVGHDDRFKEAELPDPDPFYT